MKNAFHSNGFKLLVAVIFILFGLMLYTAGSGGSAVSGLLGLVSVPMQKISTIVTNNAANTAQSATRSNAELLAENDALKSQVAELNEKLIHYYTYQQENAQLRKFLELKSENKDFKPVSAAVIGRDPNNDFHNFQIDKGSSSGIKLNDPVITEDGVAGWISSVSTGYSRVTSILSPDTKISAIDKVNRDSGVIGSSLKTADSNLLKMSYLDSNNTVKSGDIIVTSGLGGVYPRNLAIGTVMKVAHDPYDVSLYAEIKPFVDVKTIRDVMVITSFEGQGQALPEDNSSSSSASGGSK